MSAPRLASLSALGVVLLLMLPAAAQALPPTCMGASGIVVEPGGQFVFPSSPCSDPEGDPYTLEIVEVPTKGTVTTTSYVSFPGAHGLDQFAYRAVVSPTEASPPATVTILIDRRPSCSDLSVGTRPSVPVVLPEFPCQDADGDLLTILIGDPQYGTIDISADGLTVTYTPNAGFSGSDQLVFVAEEDPFGPIPGLVSELATLTITVAAPPPAPPVAPSSQSAPIVPADLTAPRVNLRTVTGKLRQALSKGLALRLTSDESATAAIRVAISRATARKLGLKHRARGDVRIGGTTAALRPGATTIRVPLTAKARCALREAKRVTVQVTVVVNDAAGNRVSRSLTVRLRR